MASDPVQRLQQMVANVKKDVRAHTRQDLADAAEAVFGQISEDIKQVTKGAFIAWLIKEVDGLEVQDAGPPIDAPVVPPFPDPIAVRAPSPSPASPGEVVVVGKVDANHTYGKTFKIRPGKPLTMNAEAAAFFRSKGLVE